MQFRTRDLINTFSLGWKRLLLIISILLTINHTYSQNYFQTIKGKVIDRDSKIPLCGANIIILGSNPVVGTSSDSLGKFRIENVPVGRQSLKISFISEVTLKLQEIFYSWETIYSERNRTRSIITLLTGSVFPNMRA